MGTEKTFEERMQEEAAAIEANKAAGKPIIADAEKPIEEVIEKAPKTEEVVEETKAEETQEKGKEEAKPAQTEKTWKEIQAEYEAEEAEKLRIKELEELANDDFIKEYKKAKNAGVDIKTFVNSIADVDVSLISEENLFKNSLADKKMSQDELEEAWEEFKTQKDYIKEAYLDKERNKITAQVEEKRKLLKGKSPIQNADVIYSEAKSGLDNILERVVNTKVDGVVVTPKMALDLMKLVPKFFATSMKDGKVDVSDAFDTAFAKLAKTQWRDELIAQGETKGLEKAFKEKHSPDANSMVASKKKVEVTKEEKEEEAWRAAYDKTHNTLLQDKN